jgi:hypothetical protein
LDLDRQRDTITSYSIQAERLLVRKKTEFQTQALLRRKAVEEKFSEEYNRMCLKHTMNVEREVARPTPEVQKLMAKATMLGRVHEYGKAHELHELATKIQAQFAEERRVELDGEFAHRVDLLNRRKAREIELLEDREKRQVLELERQYNEAQQIWTNALTVKDDKEARLQQTPQRPQRVSRGPSSARRARSLSRPTSRSLVY